MIKGIEAIRINGEVLFQQNHIGIPDKIEKLENTNKAPELQLTWEVQQDD